MGNLKTSLQYEPVELGFGTSGLRGLVIDMTDLECYINTRGFLMFLADSRTEKLDQIFIAGDLRDSTPRIMTAVAQAIVDSGLAYLNFGLIPTPALAYYAAMHQKPAIMITGSHIPADRNGIKFYTQSGEILKADEAAIQAAVKSVRSEVYGSDKKDFDELGALQAPIGLKPQKPEAAQAYHERYTQAFSKKPLKGKQIVMYQHSAVGRDSIPKILADLGAEVVCEGRSESFIPIDTENVTQENQQYFKKLATTYPRAFAIVSTDGDSDRPFMIDETGTFHRGDVLGLPVTEYLKADAVAIPISSNDAVTTHLKNKGIAAVTTKIGSPYVIEAMQSLEADHRTIMGWEVNGGYLVGTDVDMPSGTVLKSLPTRDALLPIICTLVQAIDHQVSISQLFAEYPKRYTQAGLLDDFPVEASQKIIKLFSDKDQAQTALKSVLRAEDGFSELLHVDMTDGARLVFNNHDVLHIRPSGNAPQLRAYANADSQDRADTIVKLSIQEPDGILRRLAVIEA